MMGEGRESRQYLNRGDEGAKVTEEDSILVSAVLSHVRCKGTYTEEAVKAHTAKLVHNLRRLPYTFNSEFIVSRVCTALSHMGLLESSCTPE